VVPPASFVAADPDPARDGRATERRAAEPISISVLIVNWNSRDDLADCLDSLAAQTDRDFETVVVDNGSSDGSPEMVRERFPWVVLEATGENLGFAEGCNRGIARATGQWIATLNNDAVAHARWLEELRTAAARGGTRLGMLQSRLVFKRHPDRTNSTGVVLEPNGKAYDRDFDAPVRPSDVVEEIFCPTAGAALYRRQMLEQTRLPSGYFDRTFFMFYEDVDLGWRCRLAGWEAWYVPSALVYHAFHGSADRHGDGFVVRQCRTNSLRFMLKNGSLYALVRAAPWALGWLAKSMRTRGLGGARELGRAARDALRERPLVGAMAVRPRREVEARWLGKPPRRNS
jgi:GT2 family glycosyltransferase